MVSATNERPLMKIAEVARRLNISRAYAYKLMDSGDLKFIRVGTTRRVRPEEIERLLATEG